MYAKLSPNGVFMPAPNKVKTERHVIYNPSESLLAELGYKPVTYTDMPLNTTAGYYYKSGWSETETAIVQTWTLTEGSDEIDDIEAFSILMGVNE